MATDQGDAGRGPRDDGGGHGRRRSPLGIVILAGFVILGVAAGLLLERIYRGAPPPDPGTPEAVRPGARPGTPRQRPFYPKPQSTKREIKPWEATKANSPQPSKGYIPAWKVQPPPPDPNAKPPPPPKEPPNPQTHRPPMHNPGGVNGTRPPRPIPGIQQPGQPTPPAPTR